MTIIGAIVELTLLTLSLLFIYMICTLGQVALDASIIAIVMFGSIYALTVVARRSDHTETDKHIYRS